MSSKRAVKNARRKARAGKRAVPRLAGSTNAPREPSDDEGLDALLTSRGWTVFDRAARGTMYDWPASTDSPAGEITYLIVDANRGGDADRYRVCCVNGERRTYNDAHELVADLDYIEALRA